MPVAAVADHRGHVDDHGSGKTRCCRTCKKMPHHGGAKRPADADGALKLQFLRQRGDVGDRERTIRMFHRFGASPDVVAEAVERAWLRQIPVVVVPRRHVAPGWLVMRLSPRLFGLLMAFAARRVA